MRIPWAWLLAVVVSATTVTIYFYVQTVPYAIPAIFPNGETVQMAGWDYVFAYASAWPININANATLSSVAWAEYGQVVASGKIPAGSWVWWHDSRRVTLLITNISGTLWTCWYDPGAAVGGAYLCSTDYVVKTTSYFYVYIPIPEISVDVNAYNTLVNEISQCAAISGVAFDKPVYNLYGDAYMYNSTTIGISAYQGNGILMSIPLQTTMLGPLTSVTFYPDSSWGSLYSIPTEENYKAYMRGIYILAFKPGYNGTTVVALSGGPGP